MRWLGLWKKTSTRPFLCSKHNFFFLQFADRILSVCCTLSVRKMMSQHFQSHIKIILLEWMACCLFGYGLSWSRRGLPAVSVALLPDIILHYFDVALLPNVILHYFEGRDAVFEKYTRGWVNIGILIRQVVTHTLFWEAPSREFVSTQFLSYPALLLGGTGC